MSLLTGLSLMSAQPNQDLTRPLGQVSAIVMTGESMEMLRQLTDDIGARLVGSQAYERAMQWAAAKFREAGLTNVRLEEFTLPNGWQRGPARARMVAPTSRSLRIGSVGWGPSTPPAGVRGELVPIADLSPATLRSQSAQLKNRIALVDLENALPPDQPLAFARLRDSYALLRDLGVQAVPAAARRAGQRRGLGGHWQRTRRDPSASRRRHRVGRQSPAARHLLRGPVTIEAEWHNEVTGPVQVSNVIAEIAGSEVPREWVLVGAHLDSWDLGAGAQDNGTGVVMVLEAARAIASLGKAPRRSIRFALWAAEEPSPPGSAMFIKRHAAELRDCVSVLNTDNGAGRPHGWYVNGREELRDAMRPIAEHLHSLGADGLSTDVSCGSDECPFLLEGIPALKLWVDTAQYREVQHKASDTFDKVNPSSFRAGGAVVAVTTYARAEQPTRLAPHIGQDAVRQILRNARLDVDLIYALWRP
jgi:carboxypeptidase Q